MAFINAKNKVPEHQRMYQKAYRQHTRIWKIHPRSSMLIVPYTILLWGSVGAATYAVGRKIMGHNTWFGDN